MRGRMALALLCASVLGALPAVALDDVSAGFSLTIDAEPTYSAGRPISVSGRLIVGAGLIVEEASRGVGGQQVEVLVNDVVTATAITNDEGAYGVALLFGPAEPTIRTIRAVFMRGTALQTSSRSVQTAIDRRLISLEIRPSAVDLSQGEVSALRAWGTFDDGRDEDVTQRAAWSSSDDAIAVVSNEPGSKGSVTAVAAGSSTITVSMEVLTATAAVTVS